MIDFSVTARPNPQEKDAPARFYANPQVSENMSMGDFCRHIASHGSVYSRADIQSVLTQTVDCLKEQLLSGRKILLGDLGSFQISLNSEGTTTADEFNPAIHIKKVYVNWTPGVDFLDLKQEAQWNLVANRRAQRLLLKAVTKGEDTVDISKEKEDEDGDEEA